MSRLTVIKDRLKALEEEANKLSKWGEDNFKKNTVLRFKYQFTVKGKYYTYAAIKVDEGMWYVTGKRYSVLSWDDLVEFLAEANKIKGLEMATEWEGI